MFESDAIQEMMIRDIFSSENFDFKNIVYHYTSPEGLLGILQPGGKGKL